MIRRSVLCRLSMVQPSPVVVRSSTLSQFPLFAASRLGRKLPFAASLAATLLTSGAIALTPISAQATATSSASTPVVRSLNPIASPSALRPTEPTLIAQALPVEPAQPIVQEARITDMVPGWLFLLGGLVVVGITLPQIGWVAGLIVIGEREVGIITKKFAVKSLPAGRLIALNGEAGLQADTLPPGWHFGYFPWQYRVKKESVIVIPQGEIGLIVANDGHTIPSDRILGKIVDSEDFQNARAFLTRGGEKGRQLAILTAGTYRINKALFEVITRASAANHGMQPHALSVCAIPPDKVGIITTLDGLPIAEGEIAGPIIPKHENFQKAQMFISGGGRRGLQEQVVLSGSWNLNPWFVSVQPSAMTEVPIGYVGVVISFVGPSHEDVSGDSFTHGNLVSKGDKGVWIEPLYPGKHPLNSQIMKMELVPTTNIVLNFTARFSGEHGYDTQLNALKLLSSDGFSFDLEVFQIIHVGAQDAPKVISRLGSMQNLVDQVLRPIVGNYFRNSAQEYTILDFLTARSERQAEAAEYVRQALRAYDVQAVDTLIGLITPPPELMQTLTDRKIAEEQQKTYEVQRVAQSQRQELVRETALADIQQDLVTAEEGVRIAELHATAMINQANGEAESIRLTGEAKADAYHAGVKALGSQSYTALQLMQVIGDRNVRVVPDVAVSGNTGAGLLDGMMGMLLWNQTQDLPTSTAEREAPKPAQPVVANGQPPAPPRPASLPSPDVSRSASSQAAPKPTDDGQSR
jgi:uncharacterized membrane protein YqiK